MLGERVREAVEILIRGHGDALSALTEGPDEADIAEYCAYLADVAGDSSAGAPFGEDGTLSGVSPQDIYRAACRVAMRLVVILFAEPRELLPRDNALYHESYGLAGLLERLERAAARGGLGSCNHCSPAAWHRHRGSPIRFRPCIPCHQDRWIRATVSIQNRPRCFVAPSNLV